MILKKIAYHAIPFILIGIFFWILNFELLIEIKVFIISYQAYLKAIIYFTSFVLSIIAITFCVFQKNRILSNLFIWLFSLMIYVEAGYLSLSVKGICYEDILLLIQNAGFGLSGQAIITYKTAFLTAFIWSISFLGLAFVLRRIFKKRYASSFSTIYILASLFVFGVLQNSQANRLSYPAPTKIPALFSYVLTKKLYVGPRDDVNLPLLLASDIDHIIWIIDESVRADHLEINNYERNTTPYLNGNQDKLLNFGIASSASVCSDYSHFILMSGTTPEEVLASSTKMRKKPLIFQYAKNAGYKPALVYSPGYEDLPKGYLTQYDFRHIPIRYQTAMMHPELDRYMHDFKSIDYLIEHVDNNAKSYTYFLKYGSHFHYEDAYPDSMRFYTPTQNPRDWKGVDKEKLINSYDNALRWTVDDFFKELIPRLDNKRFLIFYTSDHGQNILDHPEIGLTHCIKGKAPKVMAKVPMFIFADSISIKTLREKNEQNSKPSHFDIFPTTIRLMGYSQDTMKNNGLFRNKVENRVYFSGDIFGRSTCYANFFDD